MRKLIALILISLLIPIPSASANDDVSSTFLKIVSGNDIELQPLRQNSGWYLDDYTKVSLGVSVCRSGIPTWLIECAMNARKVTFSIVDSTGRNVHFMEKAFYSYGHGLDIATIKNINIEISPVYRLVLPLRLKAEFEFVQTSPITMQTFYYPLNVKLNKIDTAEADAKAKAEADAKAILDAKAKADAEAKAIADAKAKAQAEADAKAIAELKAKQEAEAKAKADAEAADLAKKLSPIWLCTNDPTKNKMTYSEAAIVCAQVDKEIKDKQEAEAKAIAMQLKRDLVNGSPCTKLNARKIAGGKVFTCKKINKKLIWKM
jgi:hypothetical protein